MDHWHEIVGSSNILGCGVKNGKLRVEFYKVTKTGMHVSMYRYDSKDLTLCCQMAEATSAGMFFRQNMSHLPYKRLGG